MKILLRILGCNSQRSFRFADDYTVFSSPAPPILTVIARAVRRRGNPFLKHFPNSDFSKAPLEGSCRALARLRGEGQSLFTSPSRLAPCHLPSRGGLGCPKVLDFTAYYGAMTCVFISACSGEHERFSYRNTGRTAFRFRPAASMAALVLSSDRSQPSSPSLVTGPKAASTSACAASVRTT